MAEQKRSEGGCLGPLFAMVCIFLFLMTSARSCDRVLDIERHLGIVPEKMTLKEFLRHVLPNAGKPRAVKP